MYSLAADWDEHKEIAVYICVCTGQDTYCIMKTGFNKGRLAFTGREFGSRYPGGRVEHTLSRTRNNGNRSIHPEL